MDTASKSGVDILHSAFNKVVHKAAQGTDEFIGNKVSEKIVKPKPLSDANSGNVQKNNYSTRKKRKNESIKTSIIKWKTIKYLNY